MIMALGIDSIVYHIPLQATQQFLQEIARRADDLEINGLIFHRLDVGIKKPAPSFLPFKRVARG